MAYNLELEHRIEEVTAGWPDMVKRKVMTLQEVINAPQVGRPNQ